MSLHRIRDSMGPGLEPTLGYLKYVPRLHFAVDLFLISILLLSQACSSPNPTDRSRDVLARQPSSIDAILRLVMGSHSVQSRFIRSGSDSQALRFPARSQSRYDLIPGRRSALRFDLRL